MKGGGKSRREAEEHRLPNRANPSSFLVVETPISTFSSPPTDTNTISTTDCKPHRVYDCSMSCKTVKPWLCKKCGVTTEHSVECHTGKKPRYHQHPIVNVARFVLTMALLVAVFRETGPYTTVFLALVAINNELQAYAHWKMQQ